MTELEQQVEQAVDERLDSVFRDSPLRFLMVDCFICGRPYKTHGVVCDIGVWPNMTGILDILGDTR